MNTRQVGSKAEDNAYRYLVDKGLKPIKRNYSTPYGEADLIMQDNDEFVFVEVKARKTNKYGAPADAVTKKKRSRYLLIAQYFFMNENITDYKVRFDVVEVYLSNDTPNMNYIENAYDFTDISDFY